MALVQVFLSQLWEGVKYLQARMTSYNECYVAAYKSYSIKIHPCQGTAGLAFFFFFFMYARERVNF